VTIPIWSPRPPRKTNPNKNGINPKILFDLFAGRILSQYPPDPNPPAPIEPIANPDETNPNSSEPQKLQEQTHNDMNSQQPSA